MWKLGLKLEEIYSYINSNLTPYLQSTQAKLLATWARLSEGFSNLGKWRFVLIFIFVVLGMMALFWEPSVDAPVELPPPVSVSDYDRVPLYEEAGFQRFVLVGVSFVLIILFFVFVYNTGKITLSTQSLIHRRNVLFVLSVIILAEVFSINIPEILGISIDAAPFEGSDGATGDDSSKETDKNNVNAYAFGLLGFFMIYSFVEYAFTFTSDYLKSRREWRNDSRKYNNGGNKESGSNKNTGDATSDGGLIIFILGFYRFIFDILLPVLAFVFVISYYSSQTNAFVRVAAGKFICGPTNLEDVPSNSMATINKSLYEIKIMCPKCAPAISDLRESVGTIQEYSSSKLNWSFLECDGDKLKNG